MNAARLARKWEEAGDDRTAMVEALADEMAQELVTKTDLDGAVQQLRAEIHGLRAEMHGSRTDIVKWVAGLLLVHAFGVAGMTVALIKVLA